MLNIENRISLSKKSKRKIKALLKKKSGILDGDSWSQIPKDVKSEISEKLLFNQEIRCAYCEQILLSSGHEMDHFANKAVYSRFTFIPVNLFYSCKDCNSSLRKGQKPTIAVENEYYHLCQFNIVHPYYDIPDNEIKYKDNDRIDFDWDNCTDLGKNTITFFKFDDGIKTTWRSKILILQRNLNLSTQEIIKLIQELKAYK